MVKRQAALSLEEDEIEAIDHAAKQTGVSRSEWIRRVVLAECGHLVQRSDEYVRVYAGVMVNSDGTEWAVFGYNDQAENAVISEMESCGWDESLSEPISKFKLIAFVPKPTDKLPECIAAVRTAESKGVMLSYDESAKDAVRLRSNT